jgi:hypothetical protein
MRLTRNFSRRSLNYAYLDTFFAYSLAVYCGSMKYFKDLWTLKKLFQTPRLEDFWILSYMKIFIKV